MYFKFDYGLTRGRAYPTTKVRILNYIPKETSKK